MPYHLQGYNIFALLYQASPITSDLGDFNSDIVTQSLKTVTYVAKSPQRPRVDSRCKLQFLILFRRRWSNSSGPAGSVFRRIAGSVINALQQALNSSDRMHGIWSANYDRLRLIGYISLNRAKKLFRDVPK